MRFFLVCSLWRQRLHNDRSPSRGSPREPRLRGVGFVDVLIGTSLMLIVFLVLFTLLRSSLQVASLEKAKAAASAIANSQMEYIRSLPYSSVGTVGGIPAGTIPQNATSTTGGTEYGVRTFIAYADDPADGIGVADTNGITTDYKRAKVDVTYTAAGIPETLSLVSTVAPLSLESTTGGGTLRINAVNAVGAAVPGASVRIQNPSVIPAVDLTTFANASGIVYLPGAATSTDYRITVSKSGYSSAETYARDATNQNPTPGYFTIVKDQTTTGTFAIDVLASFTLRTFSPTAAGSFVDTFADSSKLAATSSTAVSGSALILAQGSDGYVASGTARSVSTTPILLSSWTSATTTLTLPVGTSFRLRITDGAGALLPDAVLAGNTAGFSAFPVDLSGVATSTYPSLGLSADLATNATTTTPSLLDWTLSYLAGPTPLAAVSYTLTGAKTVGFTGTGAALYKTTVNDATNGSGTAINSLEYDSYGIVTSGHDITDACPSPPYGIAPGSANDASLVVSAQTANMLLVSVRESGGAVVSGASVTLSRTGFSSTKTTSACGAAYFGGLAAHTDYTVTIAKTGYTTAVYANVSVSGQTFYATSFQ